MAEVRKKNRWRRGDVFFAQFPAENFSHVQARFRPYLIIQNDVANRHSPTTIVVPMSTNLSRADLPCHVVVKYGRIYPSVVLCEQIRTVDFADDWSFLEHLPERVMKQVDAALKISLDLERLDIEN